MTNTSKTVLRISTAVALVTAALSTTVHAEYRCATPGLLTLGEKRACELAREDTPDVLSAHRPEHILAFSPSKRTRGGL